MARLQKLIPLFKTVQTTNEAKYLISWYKKAQFDIDFNNYFDSLAGDEEAILKGFFLYLQLNYQSDKLIDSVLKTMNVNFLVMLGIKKVTTPYITYTKEYLIADNTVIPKIFNSSNNINNMNNLEDILTIESKADIQSLHPETLAIIKFILDDFSNFSKLNLEQHYQKHLPFLYEQF